MKYQHPIQNTKASPREASLDDIDYFRQFYLDTNKFNQFLPTQNSRFPRQLSKNLRENLNVGDLIRVSRVVMQDFARGHWTLRAPTRLVVQTPVISTEKNTLSHLFIPGIILSIEEGAPPLQSTIQTIFGNEIIELNECECIPWDWLPDNFENL